MRRALHTLLAVAACAAAPHARAQFRETPMVLYVPEDPARPGDRPANVLPYAFDAAAPESDLLVLRASGMDSPYRKHHDMLTRLASPLAQLPAPTLYSWVAAGRLGQNGSDALTDVAYCVGTGELQISFGNDRGVLQPYPVSLNSYQSGPTITFARLLPREADFIVVPRQTQDGIDPGALDAVDIDDTGIRQARIVTTLPQGPRVPQREEVLPIRIGETARALGVDDLYLPGRNSVQLFVNETTGTSIVLTPILIAPQAGVAVGDCEGAAPLDVDRDGVLDLVVSLSMLSPTYEPGSGHLYWIRGTGKLADFGNSTLTPWADLGSALGVVDPYIVRALQLDGEPAVAVWDRALDEVLVVRSVDSELMVWRGSTAGRYVRDIQLADVVGTSRPDLIVDATAIVWGDPQPLPGAAILVYPDLGDDSPVLAWAMGSPGVPVRGEDHPLAVAASDGDATMGFPRIDWFVGDPWIDPRAAIGPSYVLSGADLCGAPPQTVPVTVRAIDEWGVYAEIGTTLVVDASPPRIEIAGADPVVRLALPPDDTSVTFRATSWTQCPNVSFQWATTPSWIAGAGGTGSTLGVTLPESTYDALLASQASVQLTATDGGVVPPLVAKVTMPLEIDASGLAEVVSHSSDLAAIAEGEVAMLETHVVSRLGVPLSSVHVVYALAGLVPAGPPEASGASVVETLRGGAEVVLDALPPSDAEVVVRLPVRTAGGRAASAVEVRSSGGHLLTPAAAAPVETAPMPGCGCGSSPAGSVLALAALLALRRRSRIT